MRTLLDTVEPDFLKLGNRVYTTIQQADWAWRHDPVFENTSYDPMYLYSRQKVEALLEECRKQPLLEAADAMAEGEKT